VSSHQTVCQQRLNYSPVQWGWLLINYGTDVHFEGDKSTRACGAEYTVIVINMAARVLITRFKRLNVGFWLQFNKFGTPVPMVFMVSDRHLI